MFINDTETQKKHAIIDPKEEARNRVDEHIRAMTARATQIFDQLPHDPDKQRGSAMTTSQLEAIITFLIRDKHLTFLVHPFKPGIKCLYVRKADGHDWYVTAYPNTPYTKALIPEFSIIERRWEWVPDPDITTITPDMVKELGEWAGFKQVEVEGEEQVRGWRSVFLRLIGEGLISNELVERRVGGSDRQNWNAKTKGNVEALY